MFCVALQPLLAAHPDERLQLNEIRSDFAEVMRVQMEKMWAAKLGLDVFHAGLFSELMALMTQTPVDYTIFFRELSTVPQDIAPLKKSFYRAMNGAQAASSEGVDKRWTQWLTKWSSLIGIDSKPGSVAELLRSREELSRRMKFVNPKYTMREWLVAPAYQQAAEGNYALIRELQDVMTEPYAEQSEAVVDKYYRLKPPELFDVGGFSFYSCSS